MQKKSIVAVLLFILVLVMSGCRCEHEWVEANCTSPKECTKCSETEGEALGHSWKAATCAVPETCVLCNETRGELLAHQWTEATCEQPQRCTVCDEEKGTPLAHTEGRWKVQYTNMVEATVTSKKFCTVCDVELDEQTVPLKALHDTTKFMLSPNEFVKRVQSKLSIVPRNDLEVFGGSSREEFAFAAYDGNEQVGIFLVANEAGVVTVDDQNTPGFVSILGTIQDSDTFPKLMVPLILSVDPQLDLDQAVEIGMDIIYSKERSQNGISYFLEYTSDDRVVVSISVAE